MCLYKSKHPLISLQKNRGATLQYCSQDYFIAINAYHTSEQELCQLYEGFCHLVVIFRYKSSNILVSTNNRTNKVIIKIITFHGLFNRGVIGRPQLDFQMYTSVPLKRENKEN